MSAHKQSCNESKLGIKAYQNIIGSLNAFERLIALLPSKDHLLLSSTFCFAVVKYAKPFIATKTPFGRTRYSIDNLYNTSDFMSDEWLNSSAPDFALIHNGLQYEELKIRRDFYGPEEVRLPNGETIQISPN